MMRTREQLFKWLEVAEAMRTFISHHPGCIEELRSRLEKVEAELAAAQKVVADEAEQLSRAEEEKGVVRAKADTLKKENEALEGQVNEVGQENLQLKNEMDELRASLTAQKKETKTLQANLTAQKEEMEAGFTAQKKEIEVRFAAQKKEMETENQWQADEMYFFGYRCCMKKNGIMHDIPSLPFDEEDATPGGPSC